MKAEGVEEVVVGERSGERRTVAEPPGTVGAAGGFRRQFAAYASTVQFRKAGSPVLPLLPNDGSEPAPDPLVERAQHRRCLAEAIVAAPSDKITR